MSDQEFTQNDDQTEERVEDLDVSEEQQDDVTGGRMTRGDDLRKK